MAGPSSTMTAGNTAPLPAYMRSNAPSFIDGLAVKNHFIGEVAGMRALCTCSGHDPNGIPFVLHKRLLDLISDTRSINLANELAAYVYRATASLVMTEGHVSSELLHLVCWAPLSFFTTQSLKVGVFSWSWLLSARPDLEYRVMAELAAAWELSIKDRRGLFSRRGGYAVVF